jgi:hypothetical protein
VNEEVVVAASVSSRVPPVAAEYHLKDPEVEELAPRLMVPGPQTEPGVTEGVAGCDSTLATTVVLVLTHSPLSNST